MDQRLQDPAVAAPPDWRGLCEELADEVEAYARDRDDEFPECLVRARAALAQPEPEVVGPTFEQLYDLACEHEGEPVASMQAALARWGRPASAPAGERQAAPVPVPVSERLPGAEDCDEEGRCWWEFEGSDEFGPSWTLMKMHGIPSDMTRWLPACVNALPLPSGEVEE